jgi:Amt family ammonium transporter
MHRFWRTALLIALLSALAVPAFADGPASKINSGDTAWMLASAALVLLMTPGLGLFYCGMVRSKNVLSVLMQSFVACGLITIQWCVFGYSLAFGPDHKGLIGDLSWAFLHNVSSWTPDPYGYGPTIPHIVYCMFQLMFAIITPALISGAVVERMKFSAYTLFILLWATCVYDPLTHWVWGHNGWLARNHVEDFAGGSVVEMASGFSSLTIALIVGRRRRSEGGDEMRPHNLPITALGAGILWFGWFGFNAGSAISSGQLAASAFAATHIAGAVAATTWMCLDWALYKKPTALGFCSGLVAGLVAITPACGFVTPMGAMIVGLGAGVICYYAIRIKHMMRADDSLDVFGVHGCGGLWGCLATGLLSTASVNTALPAHDGLLNGGSFATSMLPQLEEIGATLLICVVGTYVIAKLVSLVCGGLRISAEGEENGLDLADHGEAGYSGDASAIPAYSGAS